jgi:murein DD-endopeptidase MepM/ murein hydrolase activator NlpD
MMTQLSSPSFALTAPGLAADPRAPRDNPADSKVKTLAHEFESMLLYQMLRQMRQSMAMDEETQAGGFGADTMSQTVDLELSRQLSLRGGVGIADLIMRQLAGQSAAAGAVAPAPAPETVAPATPQAPAPPEPPAQPHRGLPLGGPITSGFGWREDPIEGNHRFHGGVDIRAAYGADVPAPAAGRIVTAREQGAYGNTVVVAHPSGAMTRYAHLSEIFVQPGDQVREGQVLGRVGSTGRSTAPHLHFEVTVDGQRVEPQAGLAAIQVLAAAADYSGQPPADRAGSRSEHED